MAQNSTQKDLLQFFLSQYPNASRLPDMNAWIQMQGRKPAGAESFGATESEPAGYVKPSKADLNQADQVIRSWRFGGAPSPEEEAPTPSPTPSAQASPGAPAPTNYHIDMKPSYDKNGTRSWSIKQVFEGK